MIGNSVKDKPLPSSVVKSYKYNISKNRQVSAHRPSYGNFSPLDYRKTRFVLS